VVWWRIGIGIVMEERNDGEWCVNSGVCLSNVNWRQS